MSDTRTAAEVVAEHVQRVNGSNGDVGWEWWGQYADGILAALAEVGYTIAGPGQVVVSATELDQYRRIEDQFLALTCRDPLPTQEGE